MSTSTLLRLSFRLSSMRPSSEWPAAAGGGDGSRPHDADDASSSRGELHRGSSVKDVPLKLKLKLE